MRTYAIRSNKTRGTRTRTRKFSLLSDRRCRDLSRESCALCDPVVEISLTEWKFINSLVAISYSGPVCYPAASMLISAAWFAVRSSSSESPGVSDFFRLPQNSYPPRRPAANFLGESCPAPVTYVAAVLRPVAFYFRQPTQLRFPVNGTCLSPLVSRATSCSWRLRLLLDG